MISGEDESSPVLNGRLRPRKSTATIPNTPNKSTIKPENKVAQDRSKRNSTPSKVSPNKQDDLTAKADSLPLAQLLCPYCDKKFSTKLSASKHARRIHLSTSKQDNFIKCLFCKHSEGVSYDIIRHMVDDHPNQYFACLNCNTRFLSTSELAEHKLNTCYKQKQAYRSKLRQTTSPISKKNQKKINSDDKNQYLGQSNELKLEPEFNGLVISCELKPSQVHDASDIEDKITTNLIMPSNIGNTVLDKNAVIILDNLQWNRRMPSNFSFRNADADQILSRLGVVHRSPRVGESTRREWLKMIDDNSQKFEKCFDTTFYSRVASNVQENLARFLDGSFNFSPDPDKVIKTRKSKSSAIINTAEGFPILLPHAQYSRNRFDGYIPRAIAPKHKWKWDSTENEKNIMIDANVMKRDNHVDNCIITLVSSLDIWTQLRMRRTFEGIFCKAPTEKIEKQNIIARELKEILESREIPCSSSQVEEYSNSTVATTATTFEESSDFPSFLGLSARGIGTGGSMKPAVLSGEWVRPRCYVCCACGDQTRDSRALTMHMAAHHPNAQVQHYEIVGESLLDADILKHLYVPPSQMSNRTRPLRGFRDCTKCKKSVTIEELHQHMLDCAGDTPTVRKKGRPRPFGVRRRRPRLPDNTMRKKMRKDLRIRHNQKGRLRARPRIRTEVGDAETIRKMIADLPAKRHRQASGNATQQVLRPRRKLDKQRSILKIKHLASKELEKYNRKIHTKNDPNDSTIDEDDQPLKPKRKIDPEKTVPAKTRFSSRVVASKKKKKTSKEVLNEPEASVDNVSSSRIQQISSDISTQRIQVNASGNDNQGDGENCDGAGNNDDDDKHKGSSPDPTLLKHSIINITSSPANIVLQLQQEDLSSKQTNTAETACDTSAVFLEEEDKSSIPDKPPLQTNQKSTSEKKRRSLLSCIEKLKNQQKSESMIDRRIMMEGGQIGIGHAHLSLMDPNPAVICANRDQFGGATNVVPSNINGPQVYMANERYQKDTRYQSSEQVDPFYSQRNTSASEFVSPKAKIPSGHRRKSFAMRSSQPHNEYEQDSQFHLAQLMQQHQWQLMHSRNLDAYIRMMPPSLQQQVLSPPNPIIYPEHLLQHHEVSDALFPFQNQCIPLSSQYHVPRLNGIVAPQININTQQNSNISSLSPQSWNRDSTQIHQGYSNHAVSNMLPSMTANEFEITNSQQKSQKRISESSETDMYSVCQSSEEANLLNHVNMQRSPFKTNDIMYGAMNSQEHRETSHYYNTAKRSGIPTITKSGHGIYDNNGASKSAKQYQIVQSHITNVNNQNYVSPNAEEEHHSVPRTENAVYDSYHESLKNVVPKSLYSSKLNKKKIKDRYLAEHPHLSPSVPTETQTAKIIHLPKVTSIHKSVGMCTRDQNDEENFNLPAFENQIDSGSTEEPLDLSGKKLPTVFNETTSTAHHNSRIKESEQITYPIDNITSDTYTDEQHLQQSISEQNNASENITYTTGKTSTVAYYTERKTKTVSDQITFLGQSSTYEDEIDGKKYRRSSIDSRKMVQLVQSKLDSYGSDVTTTPEVDTIDQLDKIKNNLLPARDKQILSQLETTDASTHGENQTFEANNEKTCSDLDTTLLNRGNNTNTTSLSIDQDSETAKKIALFPKELVELLDDVPKEQHTRFVTVISQLIPAANREIVKPVITVQKDQNTRQQVEEQLVKGNTVPICDPSTNHSDTVNRLTINTAVPSSSILPKKRHSPSTRLNSQDVYSNLSLTRQSPKLQSSFTMTVIPGGNTNKSKNTSDENTTKSLIKIQLSEIKESEADSGIEKNIDLTHDNLNISIIKPDASKSNLLPPKNCSEKTASLRAVRFKTPLSRKSISDDKQPIITKECNIQQSTCLKLRQSYLNTTQMSDTEYANTNVKIDGIAAQNEYQHRNLTKETDKRDTTETLIESENTFLNSVGACEQLEQPKIGAVTSDDAPLNSIIKQIPALSQKEQKNETISINNEHTSDACKELFSDLTTQTEIVAQKNTDHDTFLESSKSTLHTADSTADSMINDTDKDSKAVNSTISDKIENNNKIKEDHETIEVDNKIDKETSDIKEEDETTVPKNLLEPTLASNVANGEHLKDDTIDLKINTNEHIENVTDLLNLDIETIVQNVDGKEVQAANNDSQSIISQKSNPTESFKGANESFSLVDIKSKSTSGILETPIDLMASSYDTDIAITIKEQETNFKYPVTYESALLSDSELSPKETSKPALRRSKRGKSMFLDDTSFFDNDSISTIGNSSVQKRPATKKHRIFSKMLDECEQITNLIPGTTKNDNNVTFGMATGTKISRTFKRKIKSPGKAKTNKKNLKRKKVCSDLDNLNYSSDNNNKNIIEKESSCIITSNKNSTDFKAITYEKIIKYDEDDSNIKKESTQTQKLNTLLFSDTNESSRAKTTNNYSNTVNNISTEKSKQLQVKSIISENKIDVTTICVTNNNDNKKHQEKTSTCGEIRTACYNRPIVNKQIYNTNYVTDLNSKNYDPYDIDLDIDIVKTTPIVKRKGSKSVSTNNASKVFRKSPSHEEPVDKVRQEYAIEKLVLAISDTTPHNNSDSDSSISDTPLQKYVEKKEKAIKGLKSSDCNKPGPTSTSINVTKGHVDIDVDTEFASHSLKKNVINNDDLACDRVENTALSITTTDNIKSNKPGSKDATSDKKIDIIKNTADELHQGVDQIENIIETSKVKSNTKQKKDRRSITSASVNETDQQLDSDNFLATFGFYSTKTPRKSNLLASKKISETFNNIENDDADLRMNRSRKSSPSEHKRPTDDSTSKITQDVTNDQRLGSTLQSISPVASETVTVSEQACDDGEVDLITAQKMLESEEIRKLERDLYSGFKKAAEANAGKTSGFNHLRAEEPNLQKNINQDASTPTLNDGVMNPIKSPRRLESPQRSESPEMPESPESLLKDKPLMYPEEEVNIYEDKYDIIKRRREASANAKQAQKLDKPKKRKNEKSKKKPEKKNNKKCAKKSTYGSHVPTKGALKGFDGIGIKISIPTQDLNMPLNVSPPHNQQRESIAKKQIEYLQNVRIDSVSRDSDPYSKTTGIQDVYEFQDDERPLTKGYRLIRGIDKSLSISSEHEEKIEKVNQNINDKNLAINNEDGNGRVTDQEKERTQISKFKGKGKGKSKRNYTEDNGNEQTETSNQERKRSRKEKLLRVETESDLVKLSYASKTELNLKLDSRKELVGSIFEDKLCNDNKNTFETLQDNEEPYDDSDIEEHLIMPGTSGFVPDRNDESSYESDSSSRTPLSSVLKGPYACTCLSEIDSDDSETERGCTHSSCRYSHLNAAKNAVMGKIFKNNAVRCDKSDDSPNEPKPDLDQLFDSLLETNTNSNMTATRNISPVPGPSSAPGYYSVKDEVYGQRTSQINKKIHERDVSNADDGFSSPNNRDSIKVTKKSFERSSKTTQNRSNSSIMDDASTYNLSEKSEEPSDDQQYIMSQKHIQAEASAQLVTSVISYRPVEQEVPEIPTQPISSSKNAVKTLDGSLDNLDKDTKSSDYIILKNIHGEVNETQSTQTKRSVPQTDAGTSSCIVDLNAAKLARKYRKANKKHKSHHKNAKLCEDDKLDESQGNTTALKQNSRVHSDVEKKVSEQSKVKRSLSRKSDEGISTSHDNSADAYDTGVPVQRARRKCTVGKQNVLAEHWSSSESEADSAPSRLRGRKNSNKRNRRIGKMNRASGESGAVASRAPPAPKARVCAAEARDSEDSDSDCDYGSDSERYTNDQKDVEMHGWIVGDSHKKLVMRLASNKSKRRRLQKKRMGMEEYEEDEEGEEDEEEDEDEEEEEEEESE